MGEGRGEGLAVNTQLITPPQPSPSREGVFADYLQTQSEGNSLNPENQLSQNNFPPQNLPLDMNTLALLLGILQQVSQGKVKNSSELEELMSYR